MENQCPFNGYGNNGSANLLSERIYCTKLASVFSESNVVYLNTGYFIGDGSNSTCHIKISYTGTSNFRWTSFNYTNGATSVVSDTRSRYSNLCLGNHTYSSNVVSVNQ